MNVAIVTYTLFFGYGEKHRETIFKISLMKVNRYFSFAREDRVSA